MNRNHLTAFTLITLLCLLILTACAIAPTPTPFPPTSTASPPTLTITPTLANTDTPTATSEPPTVTDTPTPTIDVIGDATIVHTGTLTFTPTPTDTATFENSPSVTPTLPTLVAGRNQTPTPTLPTTGGSNPLFLPIALLFVAAFCFILGGMLWRAGKR